MLKLRFDWYITQYLILQHHMCLSRHRSYKKNEQKLKRKNRSYKNWFYKKQYIYQKVLYVCAIWLLRRTRKVFCQVNGQDNLVL